MATFEVTKTPSKRGMRRKMPDTGNFKNAQTTQQHTAPELRKSWAAAPSEYLKSSSGEKPGLQVGNAGKRRETLVSTRGPVS